MPVYNELDRYLLPCVAALLEFCDIVALYDDGSTDGTEEALGDLYAADDRLWFRRAEERTFFDHEGRLRQQALDWALESEPTHVLAVDADELILEGEKLRQQLGQGRAWSLCMREVWKAKENSLEIRQDGGWCEHPVPILWKHVGPLPLHNKKLASGRSPAAIGTLRPRFTDVAVYHFGWANKLERQERYQRYATHDGGRYHRNTHIQSIMWPDMDVTSTFETIQVPAPWVDRANRAALDCEDE
jgi:glycosyltransferase involved in cell wall biosynthesis